MDWKDVLSDYMNSEQYKALQKRVCEEYKQYEVFPPKNLIYNALSLTPYENVRVAIYGQDPYILPRQAMGLAFSVPDGVQIPPSLRNIYKEIIQEFGCPMPSTGNLTQWAQQGVLLLNSVLTVRAYQSASHKNIGWEECTDEIIKAINKKDDPVVFMLWGNFAKKKAELITNPKHLVLTSGHPSPLSCRYFFGNNHFKKCNEFLEKNGKGPIDWTIE
jgi:uracil-DNA glycosylase